MSSLIEALGTVRVLEPAGALPQAALRLDATLPIQRHEIELAVDTLCLDSTSFRQLVGSAGGDPVKVRGAILAIVAQRGKMHNPVTGSGGILTGTVRSIGAALREEPPAIGARIVTLASLTLIPLRLEEVREIDLGSPHVPVSGTAYLPGTAPWAAYPEDVPVPAALAALDVCNAAAQTRSLIDSDTRTVLVLGGGHAGLLALAAARDCLPAEAQLLLMDADERICRRARDLHLCDSAMRVDLRDAVGALRSLERAGAPRADLTIVVVNATDCEAAAILLTADTGTVLFFSMATSFTQAALGSEGMASTARMLVGSGYAADRGAYALELVSRDLGLQRALAGG